MPQMSESNKELWLWLLQAGGYWTAHDVARQTAREHMDVFHALHAMARRGLLVQIEPAKGSIRKRYGVTGMCLVPLGLTVAECQA